MSCEDNSHWTSKHVLLDEDSNKYIAYNEAGLEEDSFDDRISAQLSLILHNARFLSPDSTKKDLVEDLARLLY